MLLNTIAFLLLIIGGINWGIMAWTKGDDLFSLTHVPFSVANVFYYLVAIVAIVAFFQRKTWFPELDNVMIPPALLTPHAPQGANVTIIVDQLPANTTVVYWSSQEASLAQVQSFKAVFGKFTNSGVTMTDNAGRCSVALVCPTAYNVNSVGTDKPFDKLLHYRYCTDPARGIFSKIYTMKISNC